VTSESNNEHCTKITSKKTSGILDDSGGKPGDHYSDLELGNKF